MLDEEHLDLPQPSFDTNQYALGRIGDHNVFIVCLPSGGPGMILAAVASTRMGFMFPSLQYMLFVGTAGAIPSPWCDIRLGDVVVSTSGMIHYAWGKIVNDVFVRSTEGTKMLPHVMLRNRVTRLRSTLDKANHNISDHLGQAVQEKKALPERFRESVFPDADRLFKPSYEHSDFDRSCASCDPKHLILRPPRFEDGPYVHYGLVSSGSSIMRHSVTRDRIGRELNALCLDTEAAGLMSTYPAMVILGIRDYADSHRPLVFQNVAAARASAYAKELLKIVPAHRQNGMTHTIS